jgi:putative NADPH-quinone reductase
MNQILIINGHPNPQSFNYALAKAYKVGVDQSNSIISQINISDLKFNPNLQFGYNPKVELEPDLADAIKKIQNANHIVWIYPMWWYGYPAIMKGFIDRTFLPNIAFKYGKGKFPVQLLKGKTARIVITSDTPWWYNFFFMKSPAINQLKKGTLEFCGISPVKVTYISSVTNSSLQFRKRWLDKLTQLGKKAK